MGERGAGGAGGAGGTAGAAGGTAGGAGSGPEGLTLTTAIAEADRAGGALHYRGYDVRELIDGGVEFGQVWALLVDGSTESALDLSLGEPAWQRESVLPAHLRAELQATLAQMAVTHRLRPIHDLTPDEVREDLALATQVMWQVVWRTIGLDPASMDADRREVLQTYLVVAAEHGTNASTLAARVIAGTGADVGACLAGAVGALSGPLHGGAPQRVIAQLDAAGASADPAAHIAALLDRGERLMGFGNRVYRADDPRAAILRELCLRLDVPRAAFARELEQTALAELARRRPDRVVATNLEFWAAVALEHVGVPPEAFTAVFALARSAGWSAHVLEQKRAGRPIRPQATYTGPAPRPWAPAGGRV